MAQLSPAVVVPGGPELVTLALILAVPGGMSYLVYADAKERDNEYAASWAVTVFCTSLFYLVPGVIVLGLYQVVRE